MHQIMTSKILICMQRCIQDAYLNRQNGINFYKTIVWFVGMEIE